MATPIEMLRTQVDNFFGLITEDALGSVLDSGLPVVGPIANAAIGGLLADIRNDIKDALGSIAAAATDEAIAKQIANKLDALDGVTATAVGDKVEIAITGADSVSFNKSLPNIDVGYDGLGLKLGGDVGLKLGVDLNAALSFDVGDRRLEVIDQDGVDTASVHLEGSIKKLDASGELGFLGITAKDALATPEIKFDAGIDVAAGKVSQLIGKDLADVLDISIGGAANLKFALVAGVADPDSTLAAVIPTIYTDLAAEYKVTGYDPFTDDGNFGTPKIAFQNVEIDTGSLLGFLGDVFEPVFDGVFGSFPMKQLLNTVTAKLPVISDALDEIGLLEGLDYVDDGIINLLDLGGALASAAGVTRKSIQAFSQAISLIQGLSALSDGEFSDPGSRIKLGSFDILGGDIASLAGPANLSSLSDAALNSLSDALGDLPHPAGTPGLGNPAASLAALLDGTGFKIPLLTDSNAILEILTGASSDQPVKLIEYDVPKLEFNARFDQFFNIVGPFGVGFYGAFGAGIDFDIGYDTKGLMSKNGSFADGFYFDTVDGAPAGTVTAEVGAKAGVNIGIAEAGVSGGLFAGLNAYFDEEGQGVLRLRDVGNCMFDPITGEFGIKVQAYVEVGFSPFSYTKRFDIVRVVLANFNYGCPPPTTDPEHGLAALGVAAAKTLTLNIGDLAKNRVINGTAGKDGEESYVISNSASGGLTVSSFGINEINGNPKPGPKTDDKIVPTLIEGHAGKENDQIALDEDVDVRAMLWGDAGDDLLASGMRADELHGGNGADRLLGRAGNDKLYGEAGNDLLEGGAGADILVGGTASDASDFDQVSYENSAEGVRIVPLGGLGLFVGHGGDAEGDKLYSIEHLIGSHFADELTGTLNGSNILEGLDGADILTGGKKADLLLGGGAADVLRGQGGSDTISYLSSAGQVRVDLAAGKGSYGDAEGDSYQSIENVQGTFYDDAIIGNEAANRIDGWFGDDYLVGGGGKDIIDGGSGADLIVGGADGDTISGGGMLGSFDRDTLSYVASVKKVTINLSSSTFGSGLFQTQDVVSRLVIGGTTFGEYSTIENLWGSKFGDRLTGDAQANTILGLDGTDTIAGMDGNDTIVGGRNADVIDGGNGRDLASYRLSLSAVQVNLADNQVESGGDAQGDKLTSIEDLRGSNHADTLTGNALTNRIDAGLSRSKTGADVVDGGTGLFDDDLLIVNWSEGDIGKGLIGGFAAGNATGGWFERQEEKTSNRLDRVEFKNIERIQVIGTAQGDIISGGARNDRISAGDGNDIVYTGRGLDTVDAGAGSDAVAVGTDLNGNLSLDANLDFGAIDGGAGIDFLSLSLAATFADVTLEGRSGTADHVGTNFAAANGSAISNFEVLYVVYTGFGDDVLVQSGRWNNGFATGFGVDRISAGQGVDAVDGGLDFSMGSEIEQTPVNQTTLVSTTDDFTGAFANDGDFLEVDYSAASGGILSSVAQVDTGYDLTTASGHRTIDLYTNNGYYQAGDDKVTFSNIERVRVLGSAFADAINGTDLTYGLNTYEGPDQRQIAAESRRGDDLLYGQGGDDILFGGTGSDLLDGGDGNDVLLGAKFWSGRTEPLFDRGEVDQLTGGAGRDTFIAGLGKLFYNDLTDADQVSGHRSSTPNRAVITDFNKAEDTLLLTALHPSRAPALYYTAVEQDGNTYIYLKDGRDFDGKADASRNELIAELDGVTGFNLRGGYVLYYTPDGRYLRGNGEETDPPVALDAATAPGSHEALLDAGADDGSASTGSAPTPTDMDIGHPGGDAVAQADGAAAPNLNWVTQNADAADLRRALFGNGTPLSGGTLTLEGNSAGFGLFKGDPFGLGKGVILSTGRVVDVAGVNTIDGGRQTGQSAALKFELAGVIDDGTTSSVIYRVDLSKLGFDLNSLRLDDSNSGLFGGANTSSGFDIDAVWLSHEDKTGINDVATANGMSRIDAFNFNYADTEFHQGTLRGNANADEYTEGVEGGLVDYGRASLNIVDGRTNIATGSVTLGDGGSIGFDLDQTVKTDGPLWLYVAEAGTAGETLTTGLTASENRLEAPSDLSTDLGLPGGEDDTVSLTYTFQTRGDEVSNTIAFDFVFFSEEFAEFANAGFNDKFKVTLNGVNLARLSDGSFASVDTLYNPAAGPDTFNSIYGLLDRPDGGTDFIYNPVGTGPAADMTRADGYSRVLRFLGDIIPGGMNELKIEVQDSGDGLLDSGILIKGGEFVLDTRGDFQIDRDVPAIHEGQSNTVDFGITLTDGAALDRPVSVIFNPSAGIDLGAGVGRAVVKELDGRDPFGNLTYTVVGDGRSGADYFATIGITVRGLDGTTIVAPLVIEVDDSVVSRSYTVGDAAAADPAGWRDAWSHDGMAISHTADRAAGRYTAVTLSDAGPTVLSGGDLYAGDLGVSGNPRGSRIPQEIAGTEALRFDFAGRDVTALSIDFSAFEAADRAHIQVFRADGEVIYDWDGFNDGTGTFALGGLEEIATVIVFADAGSFLIDSVSVTENAVVRAAPVATFATHVPAGDVMIAPLMPDTCIAPDSIVHLF